MIYAYTTPDVPKHNGWIKIGYTEQDVNTRIKQQTHTANIRYNIEWMGNALFDRTWETFSDKDFHAYLRKLGVPNESGTEWFQISSKDSKTHFYEFRENRGVLPQTEIIVPYKLRDEQEQAVKVTLDYKNKHRGGEFLWNAKPRFGKTLAVYDFCKRSDAVTVLIVTNRPAIANSWYDDYVKFLGKESNYLFVSEVDALKGKPYVLKREEWQNVSQDNEEAKLIEFVSMQDMKGAKCFGGYIEKLREVAELNWDILVIDEAHEGVDTYKTDVAFEKIKRKFTLHLSGTPFKALANDKFPNDAIYNWTYADEQARKRDWNDESEEENPYAALPKLNLYTYQMSEIVKEELSQGIEIDGETAEYAFDLNEFFSVQNGRFVHDESVDKFLDALTKQKKFPFSTEELRNELRHTFWLLNRVDSAKALAKKLQTHPTFCEYKVILAAGDGKTDDDSETKKSFDKVVEAVNNSDKTITLSVGQLTTGVTIPEWTAVLMLANMKSPSLYMQAAFRAQNPYLFQQKSEIWRKQNAYVFDFDPARTLTIFEEFANNLNPRTAAGRGDTDERQENIRTLLNFFPVIGEDEQGELIELDAAKVLSIPRRIRSVEVVRRGFMCDFLFQNVSHVFGAPPEILQIIEKFTPVDEPKGKNSLQEEVQTAAKDLSIDESGEISLDDEYVIGRSTEVFGKKIYDNAAASIDKVNNIIQNMPNNTETVEAKTIEKVKKLIKDENVKTILETTKEAYGEDLRKSDSKQLERQLNNEADKIIEKAFVNHRIDTQTIEHEREEALKARDRTGKTSAQINAEFDRRQQEQAQSFQKKLEENLQEFVKTAGQTAVETIETNKQERQKNAVEGDIRDHLRGFSRTIPSFLMAYGDDTVTLATFDKIIPDNVFREVTSISLDNFRLLRDGGKYIDAKTGKETEFAGNLFDPVVFDDSVKEFLNLRSKLANYFDESHKEDIFDYIPPQKTNQIFTPKKIVKRMVDLMAEDNPGCFDSPDKTFIDLYMKSGMYITEIVKRLYNSSRLKKLLPDDGDRLRHIFEKQVYGLAPTEIIYRIAEKYILGFSDSIKIDKHNFKQADALPYAKDGTLDDFLNKLYG